jgi:hypothetical protein
MKVKYKMGQRVYRQSIKSLFFIWFAATIVVIFSFIYINISINQIVKQNEYYQNKYYPNYTKYIEGSN